jgi:hypothetical protein
MYCARCSEPIADFAVEALGQKWHTECFTCTECNCPLTSTDEDGKEIVEYFEAELQPYCKQHFTEKFCDQCLKCSKPIMGTAIEALGGKWHPECLTCGHCDRQIVEEGQYYNPDIVIHEGTSKDGDETKPYCELCYQEHICPRCVACNEPIEGMGIFALNKNWHVGCLKCAECACPLGNGTKFFTKDLLPYCHADFLRIFADRCAGCGEPIDPEEQSVNLTSIGKKYHCACLVCTHCEIPLFGKDAGSIHQHNGEPYCKDHFLELACEKCAMCNEPITGSKVKFLNKHYHRDCMRCFVCDKHLTTEVYGRGSAGLPCCHEHSQTLTMSLPPEAQKKLVDSELAEKLAKTKLAQSVDDETAAAVRMENVKNKRRASLTESKNMKSRHLERLGHKIDAGPIASPDLSANDCSVPLPPSPFPPDPSKISNQEGSTCKQLVREARESAPPGAIHTGHTSHVSCSLPFNVPMPPAPFPPEQEVEDSCLSSIRLTAPEATEKEEERPEEDEDKFIEPDSSEGEVQVKIEERQNSVSTVTSGKAVAQTMHKAGYLFKYGKVSAITKKYDWKKRYFVLIDSALTFYHDVKEYNSGKSAMKAHIFDVKRCDVSMSGQDSCDFELVQKSTKNVETILKLRAETPSQKEEWVKTIQNVKEARAV